jgi:hypothetical protein
MNFIFENIFASGNWRSRQIGLKLSLTMSWIVNERQSRRIGSIKIVIRRLDWSLKRKCSLQCSSKLPRSEVFNLYPIPRVFLQCSWKLPRSEVFNLYPIPRGFLQCSSKLPIPRGLGGQNNVFYFILFFPLNKNTKGLIFPLNKKYIKIIIFKNYFLILINW